MTEQKSKKRKHYNKLQYLERTQHQPWRWFPCWCFILVELEFRVLVFVDDGLPENPEQNPSEQRENQQQTRPTYDIWLQANPDHVGGR